MAYAKIAAAASLVSIERRRRKLENHFAAVRPPIRRLRAERVDELPVLLQFPGFPPGKINAVKNGEVGEYGQYP